jgi:FxLD family lantipeptide
MRASTRSITVAEDFVLDVQITTEVDSEAAMACPGNTDDGCDPTCASACTSE